MCLVYSVIVDIFEGHCLPGGKGVMAVMKKYRSVFASVHPTPHLSHIPCKHNSPYHMGSQFVLAMALCLIRETPARATTPYVFVCWHSESVDKPLCKLDLE